MRRVSHGVAKLRRLLGKAWKVQGLEEASAGSGSSSLGSSIPACSLLCRRGVPLQVAQKFMAHSDPKPTANVYNKTNIDDLGEALDQCFGAVRRSHSG